MAAASHRSTPSLWRDQTVSSSLRAFSFADDILSSRSLGHHSICQSRARPCLHSPSALEGQTVQWSNGRHTMTCGQQRRTVVLSDERPGSPAGSMAKSEAPSAIADRATSASIPKVAIAPRSTHNRRFSPHDGREIIPPPPTPLRAKI